MQKIYDDMLVTIAWLSIILIGASVVFLMAAIWYKDYYMLVISFALFMLHYIGRCVLALKANGFLEDDNGE